jgi:hypothetical protein
MKWSKAELKEMWREENWERKANGLAPITWKEFTKRTWVRKAFLKGNV